jgi:hypothetical protein
MVSILDILSGAVPLMVDVRQSGGSPICPDADPQLFIDARNGHIYVEVRDSGFASRHVDRVRLREWVLLMMNALASSWGIESRSDGRVVWFDLSF